MFLDLLILLKLGFIFYYSPCVFSSLFLFYLFLFWYTSLYEKTDAFRFARISEIELHPLLFTLCLFFSSSFLFIYFFFHIPLSRRQMLSGLLVLLKLLFFFSFFIFIYFFFRIPLSMRRQMLSGLLSVFSFSSSLFISSLI